MSRKYKKECATLNYIELFLILAYLLAEYISIFAFVSLLGISIEIASSG